MERSEIIEKLNTIFREIFDDETISLSDSTTSADIDGWDSLVHITIIAEIEDAFDMRFPMKRVVSMKNVGELVDSIEEEQN